MEYLTIAYHAWEINWYSVINQFTTGQWELFGGFCAVSCFLAYRVMRFK